MNTASYCPECDQRVPADSMNLQEGVALCPACGVLLGLAQLEEREVREKTRGTPEKQQAMSLRDLEQQIPRGCWLKRRGKGDSEVVIVGISTRSWKGFGVLSLVHLFWNGLTGVFFLALVGQFIHFFFGELPEWVPGMEEKPESLGELLFMTLFLTPFLLVGIGIFCLWMLSLVGKNELILSEKQGVMRTGVWIFYWRQKFDCADVASVHLKRDEEAAGEYAVELSFHQSAKAVSTGAHAHRISSWVGAVVEAVLSAQNSSKHPESLHKK